MPSLPQRVDLASLTVMFLPLLKKKKRGGAVGFCGPEPVALVESAGNTATMKIGHLDPGD